MNFLIAFTKINIILILRPFVLFTPVARFINIFFISRKVLFIMGDSQTHAERLRF